MVINHQGVYQLARRTGKDKLRIRTAFNHVGIAIYSRNRNIHGFRSEASRFEEYTRIPNVITRIADRQAAVFDLVREGNSAIAAKRMSAADARVVREAIEDFDRVLGVIALRRAEDATPDVPVNEIEQLIEERKLAKQRREFARADEIRKTLADRGILLEDTPAGTRWKKK